MLQHRRAIVNNREGDIRQGSEGCEAAVETKDQIRISDQDRGRTGRFKKVERESGA